MNIKYYALESKLYDLLQFPRLLFVHRTEASNEGYNYTGLDLEKLEDDDYISFIEKAKIELSPFSDTISQFYGDEFMCDYDFFNLLTKIYPIGGYETIDTYLDYLIKQNKSTLVVNIITSILMVEAEETFDNIESIKDEAQALSLNQTQLMQFIKDLATEPNYKWHLMMILDNPVDALKNYQTVIHKIEPIFETFYQRHKPYIEETAKNLVTTFDNNDLKTISSLTQNMIDHTFFLEKTNKILVSFVFPYAFILKTDVQTAYIVWGLKMEAGFKKLSQNYHNELDKRTQVFKNLGDITRYEVLKLIASGVSSTKVIAQKLNVSSATISYHINAFITSRVITLSSEKTRKYDVNIELIESVFKACLLDLDKTE